MSAADDREYILRRRKSHGTVVHEIGRIQVSGRKTKPHNPKNRNIFLQKPSGSGIPELERVAIRGKGTIARIMARDRKLSEFDLDLERLRAEYELDVLRELFEADLEGFLAQDPPPSDPESPTPRREAARRPLQRVRVRETREPAPDGLGGLLQAVLYFMAAGLGFAFALAFLGRR